MKDVLYNEFSRAKQKLTFYVSQGIVLELSKVLLYPKIAKVLEKNGIRQKDVLRVILEDTKIVESTVRLQVINEDEEDNRILECALVAKADVIVSGDKHLLSLGKFKKTRILAPREFFDSLSSNI
jgi:uncharacterized protein